MRQASLLLAACYGALLLTMVHWELAILLVPTEPLRVFVWVVLFGGH